MELTRRSVLHFSSIALSLGASGCTAISPRESNGATATQAKSPTSVDTNSSTDSQTQTPSLRFTAKVTRQASSESPGRVTASLTNAGSTPTSIGFGPALLFTDNTSDDDLDWANDLVPVADTYTGPNETPSKPTSGCWRYPEDAHVGIKSSIDFRELLPEQSITEEYSIYTRGNSLPCLPQGTYRFQDKGYVQDRSQELILTLILTIDENQRMSASTDAPAVVSN